MANWRGSRTIKNASVLERHLGKHRNSAEAMIGSKLDIIGTDTPQSIDKQSYDTVSIVDINKSKPQKTPSGKCLNISDHHSLKKITDLGDTGIQIFQLNALNKLILSTLLRGLCQNQMHIQNLKFTKWAPLSIDQTSITTLKEYKTFFQNLSTQQNLPVNAFQHLIPLLGTLIQKSSLNHSVQMDGFICQHNITFTNPQSLRAILNVVESADDCAIGLNRHADKVSELVLIHSVDQTGKLIKGSGPIAIFFYKPVFLTANNIKEAG